jgi:hypothetical protein
VWHSCAYARAIEAELTAASDPNPHPLYAYSDAGHGVGIQLPYQPQGSGPALDQLAGATPAANAAAKAALWPHVLAFLQPLVRD